MAEKQKYLGEGIRHATINGHRLHLRLTDPCEQNYLWINGRSPPLVLDQVAAEFVGLRNDAMWKHQQGSGDKSDEVRDHVVQAMYKRYKTPFAIGAGRVTKNRVRLDLDRIFGTIMAVGEGTCPVEKGLMMEQVRQEEWASPARMDLAVTYRCNINCSHCYTGGPRDMDELSTEQWKRVFEVLWRIGVPQVVFTGGEPLLRDDLVELTSTAKAFVTGLVTNGTMLEEMAEPLRKASLDYVQVTIESHDAGIHNSMVGASSLDAFARTSAGIKKALSLGMDVVTNTTLTRKNAGGFNDLLAYGKELGLKNMACNTLICSGRGKAAKERDDLDNELLKDILEGAKKKAEDLEINLQWYTPTCYHELNPISLGFGPKSCSAAAHNMTVQPDGTVLPCQSWPESVGALLIDPWPGIWNHPVCVKLRGHGFSIEKDECLACDDLPVCGGGCPLEMDFQTKKEGS